MKLPIALSVVGLCLTSAAQSFDGFCPECKVEGLWSTVYGGAGEITAAYYRSFYDDDGRYHHHDGNTMTSYYECSQGHSWIEYSTGSCWCGWPDNETTN